MKRAVEGNAASDSSSPLHIFKALNPRPVYKTSGSGHDILTYEAYDVRNLAGDSSSGSDGPSNSEATATATVTVPAPSCSPDDPPSASRAQLVSSYLLRVPRVPALFDPDECDSAYTDPAFAKPLSRVDLDVLECGSVSDEESRTEPARANTSRRCSSRPDGAVGFLIKNRAAFSPPLPLTCWYEFKPKSMYEGWVRGMSCPAGLVRFDVVNKARGRRPRYHPRMFYNEDNWGELVGLMIEEAKVGMGMLFDDFKGTWLKRRFDARVIEEIGEEGLREVLAHIAKEHWGGIKALIESRCANEGLGWGGVGLLEEMWAADKRGGILGRTDEWWSEGWRKYVKRRGKNGNSEWGRDGKRKYKLEELGVLEEDTLREGLLGVLEGMAWRDVSIIACFSVQRGEVVEPAPESVYASDTVLPNHCLRYTVKVIDHDMKHPSKLVQRESLERKYFEECLAAMGGVP